MWLASVPGMLLPRAVSSPLLYVLIATAGCYNAIGVSEIRPKAPPPLVDGQTIEATDEVVHRDSYHINSRGDFVQNRTRLGDASYGGEHLTISQAAAMAHPEHWQEVISKANDLRATCRRGVVPEIVATVATFAMTGIGIAVGASHGDSSEDLSPRENAGVMASYGAAGVAAASYVVGYLMGGRACGELAQFRANNYIDSEETKFVGDEVELINKLARDFNTHGHAAPGEPAEPPSESSGAQ